MSFSQKFRDWASMARLPNVPTVWSNIFTAWVLAGGGFAYEWDLTRVIAAMIGGTLLYAGGTTLGDTVGAQSDRIHRPERPIPAGRISSRIAHFVAAGLLGCGLAAFCFVGGYAAVLLLICILGYAYLHERSVHVGILLMGACRVMLAETIGVMVTAHFNGTLLAMPGFCFWIMMLFLYVCVLSWLAMKESVPGRRRIVIGMLAALPLLDGTFLILMGFDKYALVVLGCFLLTLATRRIASAT